ncbi:hypothetical protein M2401_004858 [Pseudomonas sp. JUb42]|jgi:hypothetical protein|nr:hypothetical protein [Pseudomonas sp. JUb42]
MFSSDTKSDAQASKAERLNAALAAYKLAKQAGKVRRVSFKSQ